MLSWDNAWLWSQDDVQAQILPDDHKMSSSESCASSVDLNVGGGDECLAEADAFIHLLFRILRFKV